MLIRKGTILLKYIHAPRGEGRLLGWGRGRASGGSLGSVNKDQKGAPFLPHRDGVSTDTITDRTRHRKAETRSHPEVRAGDSLEGFLKKYFKLCISKQFLILKSCKNQKT